MTDAVTARVKQGFSAPDESLFKGESIDFVRQVTANPKSRIYDYLDSLLSDKSFADREMGHALD